MQIFCLTVFALSLTSQVTFSRFRSSFLSDLYCSDSEVKLVAEITTIAAQQQAGIDSAVGGASGEGSEGSWLQSRRGQMFLHP